VFLHRTTAASTPPRLGHKSFVVSGPLALLGNALYAVLVHRLAIYAPRFLPTLGHPHAVALRFVRCDQLTAGLAPAKTRPCWAHRNGGVNPALPRFIGPHSTIEAGAQLGRACLVQAHSRVRGAFPDFSVIGGQPARVLGDVREANRRWLAAHPEWLPAYEVWALRMAEMQ